MTNSLINKDYMNIDEFLSSRDICDGLSFPEGDYTDEEFSGIADTAEGIDVFNRMVEDQLNEYTANEIEIQESTVPRSPLSSADEGCGGSISPNSVSSNLDSPIHEKLTKQKGKTRSKRSKKIDGDTGDSRKARTSTWQMSKSSDKKCLATSVEIEGISYTYKLLPTTKGKKQRKQSVPGEKKDGKYWDRRLKNNMAAKRSRDLRRQKEMTVAYNAAALEKENDELRSEVTELREQVRILNKRLQEK